MVLIDQSFGKNDGFKKISISLFNSWQKWVDNEDESQNSSIKSQPKTYHLEQVMKCGGQEHSPNSPSLSSHKNAQKPIK